MGHQRRGQGAQEDRRGHPGLEVQRHQLLSLLPRDGPGRCRHFVQPRRHGLVAGLGVSLPIPGLMAEWTYLKEKQAWHVKALLRKGGSKSSSKNSWYEIDVENYVEAETEYTVGQSF